MTAGIPMVIAAAAAGIVADLVAARVAGQHGTARTTAAAALVAAAVAYGMVVHAPHTWHGRLMPLWAWGWLVVADLDLRTRFVLDLHVAVLGVVAVLAAVLDRETVLSVAGAVVVAGALAAINMAGEDRPGRLSPVGTAAGVGLALGGIAWMLMWHFTWIVPVRGVADPRVVLTAFLVVSPPIMAAIVRSMARRARAEGWHGELVGWGDVMLAGLIGLWFGLRWVWAPLAVGLGAAAAMGAIRWVVLACSARQLPWLREAQPTVPGLFVGVVLGVLTGR